MVHTPAVMRHVRQIAVVLLLVCLAGWQHVSAFPEDTESLLRQADRHIAAKQFTAARRGYEQAIQGGANIQGSPVRARNLAEAYLNSSPPDLTKAIHWLQISLAHDSAADGTRALLAQALARADSYSDAIEQYQLLVHNHPSTPEYVLGLSGTLRQAGRTDAALQFLQSTLANAPDMNSVRLEYARLLNYSKQFAEAKTQYEIVLQHDPDNLAARVGVAKATSWRGDQERALELYNRILRQQPGCYDALVGKAFTLLWMGRDPEAQALLELAQRRNPGDTEVREALNDLSAKQTTTAMTQEKELRHLSHSSTPAKGTSPASPTARPVLPVAPANSGTNTGTVPTQVPARPAKYLGTKDPAALAIAAAALVLLLLIRGTRRRHTRRNDRSSSQMQSAVEPGSTAQTAVTTVVPLTEVSFATDNKDCREKGRLEGVCILLVANQDSVLAAEQQFLRQAGAEASSFTKWQEALSWLDANDPQAILLNPISADQWSGFRIYLWMIKHRPILARKTVLVFFARDESTSELQRSTGAICAFQPLRSDELLTAVETAIKQSSYAVEDRSLH